jgi:hypothetical protein
LDILNNHVLLLKQLRGFVGFMYSQYDCKTAYTLTRNVFRTFEAFAKYKLITPQVSPIRVSEGTGQCIDEFKALRVNPERLTYLDGWQLKSKEGKVFNFPIGEFHEAFGDEMTADIYYYTCQYSTTQKTKTLVNTVRNLSSFLNSFATHCHSADDLRAQLKANKLNAFFEKVMWCSFSRYLVKGYKGEIFFKT